MKTKTATNPGPDDSGSQDGATRDDAGSKGLNMDIFRAKPGGSVNPLGNMEGMVAKLQHQVNYLQQMHETLQEGLMNVSQALQQSMADGETSQDEVRAIQEYLYSIPGALQVSVPGAPQQPGAPAPQAPQAPMETPMSSEDPSAPPPAQGPMSTSDALMLGEEPTPEAPPMEEVPPAAPQAPQPPQPAQQPPAVGIEQDTPQQQGPQITPELLQSMGIDPRALVGLDAETLSTMGLTPEDVDQMVYGGALEADEEDPIYNHEPRLFMDGPAELPPELEFPADDGEGLVQSRVDRQEGGLDLPHILMDPRGPDPMVILTERGFTRVAADESPEEDEQRVHPLEVADFLVNSFGRKWMKWEEGTIKKELTALIKEEPDEETMRLVYALQTLASNPRGFWEDHDVFENVILGLNGLPATVGVDDFVSPGQLVFGVRTVRNLIPGEPGDAVKAYVASRLFGNPKDINDSGPGILYAPEELQFAQDYLDMLSQEHGGQVLDKTKIAARLAEFKDTSLEDAPLSSADPVDNQVALLLGINEYVKEQEAGV